MTDAELRRRLRIWDRIWKMKISKDTFLSEVDLNKWRKQYLPGDITRNTDIKLKRPSKVKKGDTWSNIQTAISLTVDQRPQIEFIAGEENDAPKAIVLQNVLDYLWDKNKGDIELYWVVLSAAVYGTGIMKSYYRVDKRKIKDIKKFDPKTNEIEIEETTRDEFDDIAFETVDVHNFFPDNRAKNMRDAIDCFERYVISKDQFNYIFDDERYKNKSLVIDNQGWFYPTNSDMRVEPVFSDYTSDKIEIIEYYNKYEDEKIVYANGIEILYSPIPYRHKTLPYSRVIFFPKERESFWGIGIPELTASNQAALDTMFNMMIDREKLSINKPTLVGGGETFDDTVEIYAGQQRSVIDVNNYKEMQIEPVNNSHIGFLDYISRDNKILVGADDVLQGQQMGGTATENAIAKESGLRRMKVFLKLLEGELMYDLGRQIVSLIQQFYSEPLKVVKIVGGSAVEKLGRKVGVLPKEKAEYRKLPINLKRVKGEFQENLYEGAKGSYFEITPDDISGNFDVKVVANSSIPVSNELEIKKLNDAVAIASGSGIQNVTNWGVIAKEFWGKVMKRDGSRYIIDKTTLTDEMNGLAEEENIRMMAGENIQSTKGATPSHTARHQALWESTDFETLSQEAQQIIIAHGEGELSSQNTQQATQAPGRQMVAGNQEGGGMSGTTSAGMGNASREQMGMPNPPAMQQPNQQIKI